MRGMKQNYTERVRCGGALIPMRRESIVDGKESAERSHPEV